ncbi:MAG: shikimate dehydrogenase [Cytophagales bacterium]|nr:shikimate dehydrogenase [Cytophagales bacterium]
MHLYGLLGKTLSHSFSKKYFTHKFETLGLNDHAFELFEIPRIEDFPNLVSSNLLYLCGMNVTIPYKVEVIQYLQELDNTAIITGAVNVIKVLPNSTLKGYNTDYYGFKQSLLNTLAANDMPIPPKALILGTGGASKAVIAALNDLNVSHYSVSRDANKTSYTYNTLTDISEHKLIINCTPLGTYPKVEDCPAIPYSLVTSQHLLFDLVYNPEVTAFMKNGLKFGAKVVNGLEMLHLQAEKAWEIWQS